jgi:hypothetical protein
MRVSDVVIDQLTRQPLNVVLDTTECNKTLRALALEIQYYRTAAAAGQLRSVDPTTASIAQANAERELAHRDRAELAETITKLEAAQKANTDLQALIAARDRKDGASGTYDELIAALGTDPMPGVRFAWCEVFQEIRELRRRAAAAERAVPNVRDTLGNERARAGQLAAAIVDQALQLVELRAQFARLAEVDKRLASLEDELATREAPVRVSLGAEARHGLALALGVAPDSDAVALLDAARALRDQSGNQEATIARVTKTLGELRVSMRDALGFAGDPFDSQLVEAVVKLREERARVSDLERDQEAYQRMYPLIQAIRSWSERFIACGLDMVWASRLYDAFKAWYEAERRSGVAGGGQNLLLQLHDLQTWRVRIEPVINALHMFESCAPKLLDADERAWVMSALESAYQKVGVPPDQTVLAAVTRVTDQVNGFAQTALMTAFTRWQDAEAAAKKGVTDAVQETR